jgi:Leucine-rich repeat (LRR) protein
MSKQRSGLFNQRRAYQYQCCVPPPPPPLPQDTGVVINFKKVVTSTITYGAPENGYYTINGNNERFFMPGGVVLENINIVLYTFITIYSPSITYLYLEDSGISAVPDLTNLTSLIGLYFAKDSLTGFTNNPNKFPSSLQTLKLSSCNLSFVPDLTNLTHLIDLELNENDLTGFVTSLDILPTSLQNLYLNECKLDDVPNLTNLTSLINLRFGLNNLIGFTNIPNKFPSSLQVLVLPFCSLTFVPDLTTLNNLIDLVLSNNNITQTNFDYLISNISNYLQTDTVSQYGYNSIFANNQGLLPSGLNQYSIWKILT